MADAGFFRGTSTEQDSRFSDKQKKLMKQMKFSKILDKKVDMTKVNLEILKPWISKRIIELLDGVEDEVLLEFVFCQLEAERYPDAKTMQINLSGFLNTKNSQDFMADLWTLLISAESSPDGVPTLQT